MSIKREDVLKYLEEANMIEISELVKDIEEKFGVTAAAPVAAAAPGAVAEGGDADAGAEKSTVDVILTSVISLACAVASDVKFSNTNSEIYLVKKKIRDLKPKKRLLGIKLTEKGIPRKNQKILDPVNNKIIGEITSGTFSPTINSGIALGYLNSEYLTDYKNIIVDIRGKNTKGKIINIPFVKSKPLK